MRITSNATSSNLLSNLQKSQNKLYELQNKMGSSTRINKPSDDPAGVENILKLKSGLARVNQWQGNADQALTYMDTADGVMANIGDALQRVHELAVQGASDILTANDRQAIKMEIDQTIEQLNSLSNSKVGDKAIFYGTRDSLNLAAPMSGNSAMLGVEVGNNINVDISVNGLTLFQTPTVKLPNGSPAQGVFDTLNSLSTALGANNGTAISNLLADIDANEENISLHRADLGARINRVTAAQAQLNVMATNLQQNLSSVQDTDMAKTITEYTNQENVYKAAISIGAQIMQLSLVDYMR